MNLKLWLLERIVQYRNQHGGLTPDRVLLHEWQYVALNYWMLRFEDDYYPSIDKFLVFGCPIEFIDRRILCLATTAGGTDGDN